MIVWLPQCWWSKPEQYRGTAPNHKNKEKAALIFRGVYSCSSNGEFRSITWWRHLMKTFSALLAICAGNSPVPGEFPTQRPVTRSFHVFFDLRLNKPLSKQSWDRWFETLSRPLWRHCYDISTKEIEKIERHTIVYRVKKQSMTIYPHIPELIVTVLDRLAFING